MMELRIVKVYEKLKYTSHTKTFVPEPGSPLFWAKIEEKIKAGMASKTKPPLGAKQVISLVLWEMANM